MGCSTCKEDLNEQEYQNIKQASKQEIEGKGEGSGNGRAKQSSEKAKKWGILDKLTEEEREVKLREKEINDNILDPEEILKIVENSSPEFGFDEVLGCIVTEGSITDGAAKNIIVLSQKSEKKILKIRVFGVSEQGIKFEFLRKFELESAFTDTFRPGLCFYDQIHQEVKIYRYPKKLLRIKLKRTIDFEEGDKVTKTTNIDLRPQSKFLEDHFSFNFHTFKNEKAKATDIFSNIFLNQYYILGEVRRALKPSLNLMRVLLRLDLDRFSFT